MRLESQPSENRNANQGGSIPSVRRAAWFVASQTQARCFPATLSMIVAIWPGNAGPPSCFRRPVSARENSAARTSCRSILQPFGPSPVQGSRWSTGAARAHRLRGGNNSSQDERTSELNRQQRRGRRRPTTRHVLLRQPPLEVNKERRRRPRPPHWEQKLVPRPSVAARVTEEGGRYIIDPVPTASTTIATIDHNIHFRPSAVYSPSKTSQYFTGPSSSSFSEYVCSSSSILAIHVFALFARFFELDGPLSRVRKKGSGNFLEMI